MRFGVRPEGKLFGEDKCPCVPQWEEAAIVEGWHPIGLPGGQLSLNPWSEPQALGPDCRLEGGSVGIPQAGEKGGFVP